MYPYSNPFNQQLEDLKRQLENLQHNTMQPVQPIMQIPQIPTVHGYEGMKNYFVPASGSAVALDADSADDKLVFYVKVVDSNGIATIKAYDGYERQEASKDTESQYVSKADFDKLANQLAELTKKITAPISPDMKEPEFKLIEKEPAPTSKKGGRSA